MRAIFERDFGTFAQKRRYFVLRGFAVGLPLLCLMPIASRVTKGESPDELGLAIFAATTFPLLLTVLFVTPAMFAHVLAEERKDRKLEVLRSAQITAAGIVLGKWVSRLALMVSVFLAALPLTASALLFGGVRTGQFLEASFVILLTLCWVSALSIWISARSFESGAAVRVAYVMVVGFVTGTFLIWVMNGVPFSQPTWRSQLAVAGLSLNPLMVLSNVIWPTGLLLGVDPLPAYTLFSIAVTLLLLPLSVLVLPRQPIAKRRRRKLVAADDTQSAARAERGQGRGLEEVRGGLPRTLDRRAARTRSAERAVGKFGPFGGLLWTNPAVWLEVQRARFGGARSWVFRIVVILVVFSEVAFFIDLLGMQDDNIRRHWSRHLYPLCGLLLMAFLTLASAGASAFHRDSHGRTLEVLHATPLDDHNLAWSKILATLYAGFMPWGLLAMLHVLAATGLGHLNPIGCFGFLVAVVGLFLGLTAFSLLVSLAAKNLAQANLRVLGAVVAHLFLSPVMGFVLMFGAPSPGAAGVLFGHHPFFIAMTPLILSSEREARSAGEIFTWPALYWGAYVVWAILVLAAAIPTRYAKRRENGWSAT